MSEQRFKVGDLVQCSKEGSKAEYGLGWLSHRIFKVAYVTYSLFGVVGSGYTYFGTSGSRYTYCDSSGDEVCEEALELVHPVTRKTDKIKTTGENIMSMNPLVANLFPKTADALIVDKHFGSSITPVMAIALKGKEKELLEEAKLKEDNENRRS